MGCRKTLRLAPTANLEDAEVAVNLDEDLPCPDPLLIDRWHKQNYYLKRKLYVKDSRNGFHERKFDLRCR
jgi:hypothetical protein